MKILLINNHTRHFDHLQKALADHEVEVQLYEPGIDFHHHDKDMIILSGGGGEGLEIHDEHQPGKLWYDDQMRFIRDCQKPILGICMGFEVIARAFGAPVKEMGFLVEDFTSFNTTTRGRRHLGRTKIRQFEAHRWHVTEAPKEFDVLAASPNGIEIIRHKTRPIIATQFHPEKGGTLRLTHLLSTLTN